MCFAVGFLEMVLLEAYSASWVWRFVSFASLGEFSIITASDTLSDSSLFDGFTDPWVSVHFLVQSVFSLLFKLHSFCCSVFQFAVSFPVVSILLLTLSAELVFQLLYFSVLTFPFGYLVLLIVSCFFAETVCRGISILAALKSLPNNSNISVISVLIPIDYLFLFSMKLSWLFVWLIFYWNLNSLGIMLWDCRHINTHVLIIFWIQNISCFCMIAPAANSELWQHFLLCHKY